MLHELSIMRNHEIRSSATKEARAEIEGRYDMLLDNESMELQAAKDVLHQIEMEINPTPNQDRDEGIEQDTRVVVDTPAYSELLNTVYVR